MKIALINENGHLIAFMTFLSYIEYIEEIRHVDTSCAPFAQFQFVL